MRYIFFVLATILFAFPAAAEETTLCREINSEFNGFGGFQCGSGEKNINHKINQGTALAASADTYLTDHTKPFHLNLNLVNGDFDSASTAVGISFGYKFTEEGSAAQGLYIGVAGGTLTDGDDQVVKGTVGYSW